MVGTIFRRDPILKSLRSSEVAGVRRLRLLFGTKRNWGSQGRLDWASKVNDSCLPLNWWPGWIDVASSQRKHYLIRRMTKKKGGGGTPTLWRSEELAQGRITMMGKLGRTLTVVLLFINSHASVEGRRKNSNLIFLLTSWLWQVYDKSKTSTTWKDWHKARQIVKERLASGEIIPPLSVPNVPKFLISNGLTLTYSICPRVRWPTTSSLWADRPLRTDLAIFSHQDASNLPRLVWHQRHGHVMFKSSLLATMNVGPRKHW